jgi:hypothetical protein
MPELIPYLMSYGLPGAVVAAAGWLLYRLVDRGFELLLRIPPKD